MNTSTRLFCLTAVILCALSYADNDSIDNFWGRFDFLTEYYATQDVRTFFNHKNDHFHEEYLISTETFFEVMIVSYDTAVHFGMFYMNYLGMGRQSAQILFDPRESHYALTPFFEYRRNDIFYQAGLDHRCFHQVDRKQRPISPYWNQAYIKASSANYRFKQMKQMYIDKNSDSHLERLRWSAWAGYFIRKFGGMDVTLLSGGHPWGSTIGTDAAYSFYKTKSWMFSGRNELVLFADTTGKGYWTGMLGVDADIYNRKNSFGFFLYYNYEFPRMLPLYSKDQLFDFGMRWRF